MEKQHILLFFSVFAILNVGIRARAFPNGDSHELVGVNVGGLKADLKTNLFDPDGPLAQLGNELTSGAAQLQNELTSGAKALESNLNNAANFMNQGSQEEIAGVNIGGLKADLKTNLFSKTGPLAQLGNELAAGAGALEDNLQKGADELSNSLAEAANDLQAKLEGGADLLTKGLQDLGNQISSASGGASLDSLFQGGGDLFSNLGADLGLNSNGGETDTISISTKTSGIPSIQASGNSGFSIFGSSSGKLTKSKNSNNPNGITVTMTSGSSTTTGKQQSGGNTNKPTITRTTTTRQNSVLTPQILAELSKSINLSEMCKAMKN